MAEPFCNAFVVSLYAQGDRRAADCLPAFYRHYGEAYDAARREITRVAAMPESERVPYMDFAVRFTIRKERVPMFSLEHRFR